MSVDETALRRALRSGDSEQVVRLLEPLAWGVASDYYAAGLERQDLAQAARIGIAEAARDWNRNGSFVGFARLCAKRQVITAVKAALRAKHGPVNEARSFDAPAIADTEGLTLADVLGHPLTPLDELVMAEDIAAVREAIASRLSPLELAAVLGWLAGDAYALTAEREGTSIRAIDNGLQRAIRKLTRFREEYSHAS